MAPACGKAFFSTEGGRYLPRAVLEPPNVPIARNQTTSQFQVHQHAQWLRETYPKECNQIFEGYFDIGDYFDPYDRQLLGTHFLQEVLDTIAKANHYASSIFIEAWAAQNKDKVVQVRDGKSIAVFSEAEIEERGRMFLKYALLILRKMLVIWAKKKVEADAEQAVGAHSGTEVGHEASPLHTLGEETPEVKVSTSQPQADDHQEGPVPLASSPPPEDDTADRDRSADHIRPSPEELPKLETHVTRSNESEKKQATVQTSASSPCATKATTLAPPTPRTTVSSPATMVNNDQRHSPHRHVKSQASTHTGPAFNPRRGTQVPQYQPAGPVWMNMHDPRINHPPAGFMSPPPAPHASLDQMLMSGPGFMPMHTQPMMPGAPFPNGNQWQSSMHIQKQHQAPSRFGHRNSVDPPPVFISNTLKADMSRQTTPQMQNAYPTQQYPFMQYPGSFRPPFPQPSPYPENAALGNITNMEHQYGPQAGNRRRVSASRNDHLPPPQVHHIDSVLPPHQNPNDFVAQPVRDRRFSFAGPPGRKSRRGSFRGGHAGTFHDRHPSDNGIGANNLPSGGINTEPFPSYMTNHNPLTIYVANIPDYGSDMEHAHGLRTLFSNKIGKSVENVMVRFGKTNRRYALISFFHIKDIQEALKLHSTEYLGMRLQVNPFQPNSNGSFGYRNTQANPRGAPGSIFHHDLAFSMNSAKMGAGNNHPTRNRNVNDRRPFNNGKNRPFNTKYSPQDARSTIPTQDSDLHLSGIAHPSTTETDSSAQDAKKTAESSKSGRSTPSTGHQGSSTKAKKKTRREEVASVKSEGGGEKITTIHEDTSSGRKVKELFLNPSNELVDESGQVVYKLKVDDKGEGKAIASETESSEKSQKDSSASSGSRQQSLSMNQSASVGGSKASKPGHDESPACGRQRQNRESSGPESTQNSEASSLNVDHSNVLAHAAKNAQDHHESAPRTTADSDAQSPSSASRDSYAKAAANVQTPEKGSQEKSKSSQQPEKSDASPDTPSTVTGTPGPTASPEGDESFVTAQEDVPVAKKDKQGKQHASKKRGGKRSLPRTNPESSTTVHGDEHPSLASSPATVVGPPPTNRSVETTPREHSVADVQKPNDSSDAPKPKHMIKSQETVKSEDVQTSIDSPISGGPTKPAEAVSSGKTTTFEESAKVVDALKSAEAVRSADSPEPTEPPKVEETPKAGSAAKEDVVPKSNASDSTVGEEQFFTPPPQKAEFDVMPENPMQERPPNVEASGSKSGPKQTSSIHPFARQKDQKKKKAKKNKKEQQKGPLYGSKAANAMTTTTEPHQQVLSEHLSSEVALDQNDNQNQQIKSHQPILDSRPRSPIPTARQTTLNTRLTSTSSTVSKSERRTVVDSGSIMSDGLDSTLYLTTMSTGGSESGDQAETISERNGGLGTEQQLTNEADVQQSSVNAEDAPAGEPGDAAGSLRTADHAAGESENRDETSNAETSQVTLADAKPSVVEGSQTCASDAADAVSIDLAGKQSQNEKKKLKEKAKKQRQRAAKRAQEEQEKEVRSEDETHVDLEVHGNQVRINTSSVSSKDEEHQDLIKVVECRTQNEDPKPLCRVVNSKYTPHTLSRDQRFQGLCSNAIRTLQELDDTGPASSNYAVPVLLSEPDSSDELEIYETIAPNTPIAEMPSPNPIPPTKSSNARSGVGAIWNQAQSSLNLRGATTTTSNYDEVFSADRHHPPTSKSQDNRRVVDGVEEPSESLSPCKKLLKGTGKRPTHEMNRPVEVANVPGKHPTPSFYDDFEIDADNQSHLQRDDHVTDDGNANAATGNEENMDAISKVISRLASMRALLDIQVRMERVCESPENNASLKMSEDGAEEENDGGEGVKAGAGSSKSKVAKKKTEKGNNKGKKKW